MGSPDRGSLWEAKRELTQWKPPCPAVLGEVKTLIPVSYSLHAAHLPLQQALGNPAPAGGALSTGMEAGLPQAKPVFGPEPLPL